MATTRTSLLLAMQLAVGVVLLGGSAEAQNERAPVIVGGAGWSTGWDDETFLGRGPTLTGGVALPFHDRLLVEGVVDWLRHDRDAGYLIAHGTSLVALGRGSVRFRPASRSKPFVSGGVGIMHATGYFDVRTFVPDPRGFPIEGPRERQSWSLTQPVAEVGGGVEVRATTHLSVRPEFRWRSTLGSRDRSVLETPIWLLHAGVAVLWQR